MNDSLATTPTALESVPAVPRAAARPAAGARRWGALAATCLAVVVIVMDGSIVNVALPTLAVRLPGASNSGLQWIVDAYILVFASLLLGAGSAADRFGRRRVLLLGLGVFAAVSLGAALAGTTARLIAWRAAMGIGAALIFPSTLAIITEDFPERGLRRTAIAIWAGASGLGVAIGPVAGGWLLEHLHWGSIFLINLPVVLIAAVGVGICVRESKDEQIARFDALGCVLAILGVLGVVWGLIEAPERGWLSPLTLASMCGGLSLLVAFVVWERCSDAPMLDVRYFTDRHFAGGCVAITAAFFGLFGFVFMATQYFQFLQGYSALASGIRTLPFAGFILGGSLTAAWAGRVMPRGLIIAVGLSLMASGFAWATTESLSTPYLTMVLQMGLLGVGLGLVNAAGTEAIMSSLPQVRAGTGSSVNDTLREVGGTLGVAGMGSAFNALYRSHVTEALSSSPLPAPARELITSSIGAANEVVARIGEVAGSVAARAVLSPVQSAFLEGFRASCWIACGATALGAVLALMVMRGRPANSA